LRRANDAAEDAIGWDLGDAMRSGSNEPPVQGMECARRTRKVAAAVMVSEFFSCHQAATLFFTYHRLRRWALLATPGAERPCQSASVAGAKIWGAPGTQIDRKILQLYRSAGFVRKDFGFHYCSIFFYL